MNKHFLWGKYAAALAIFLTGFSAVLAAQTAPADAWRRVPPAPTSCFSDDYRDKLYKVAEEIQADINKQSELNAQIRERFDKIDIMEKMQRMQAFLMKNPQEAAKVMQAMQAAGTAVNANIETMAAEAPRLEQEKTQHIASFNAAMDKAVKPVHDKQSVMIKTRTREVGEAAVLQLLTPADDAQYVALIQQENAEYEKACVPYFGPAGVFPKWLASYRANVTEKLIGDHEANENVIVSQMAIMDTPSGGYRSTAALEQVRQYLTVLGNIYDVRRRKAVTQRDLMLSK